MADSVPRLDAYHFYQQDWDSYEELLDSFEWEIPDRFNIAEYICDRWAEDKGQVMIFGDGVDPEPRSYTFWQVKNYSNQLANLLSDAGIGPSDRVGLNLSQRPETLITHIAIWKLGAISVPLSTLFGPDALAHRLEDSDAKAIVVEESNIDNVRTVVNDLGGLETVLTLDESDPADVERDFWKSIANHPREFDVEETSPDDGAVIYYTSGTTGGPKGCLQTHSHLLGVLPQFQVGYADMQVEPEDLYWTPSDWAWAGSLLLHILTALFYGRPVLAYQSERFDPERTFDIFENYGVTHAFLAPTAIRMMQQIENPQDRFDLEAVKVVWSGGEDVGQGIVDWVAETFDGAKAHSSYGLTEAAGVLCNATVADFKENSTGRTTPGHEVTIIDPETAEPVGPNEKGEIGVRYENDPCVFQKYWNRPKKTNQTKFNGFLRTGDLATMDEEGYFSFIGRKDDIIITSGYRVGPEEVENAIADHEAVENAGVIGIPDDERGKIIKAFVKLGPDYNPNDDVKDDIRAFVKNNLAKYEFPREIELVDELPLTTTGKIQRHKLREREGL